MYEECCPGSSLRCGRIGGSVVADYAGGVQPYAYLPGWALAISVVVVFYTTHLHL
jgi:hypothetical protein